MIRRCTWTSLPELDERTRPDTLEKFGYRSWKDLWSQPKQERAPVPIPDPQYVPYEFEEEEMNEEGLLDDDDDDY